MIEVYFGNRPGFAALDIYILERIQNGKTYLFQFKKGNTTLKEVKEYEFDLKPTFVLPTAQANDVLKAFADAVAARGIKTDEDKKREGKLEAVEKHLSDMQRLVFKDFK